LSSFLITTPQGHVLINSTYERNAPTIAKSVEQLGFKFADVKILLGTHAHRDHQEGDALVKQMTGAQVMAMAEDVPALRAMNAGDKDHPVDRMLRDGERVTLGGTTLVAHLTAGHTRGCTTWTTAVQEAGRTYNVVIKCSLRAPAMLTRDVVGEVTRTFKLVRSLRCDVPLGDHPAQYDMRAKHAKLAPRRPGAVGAPPVQTGSSVGRIKSSAVEGAVLQHRLEHDRRCERPATRQALVSVSSLPVLSPNSSTCTPSVSKIARYRLAIGVPRACTWCTNSLW
jgi:metallo-beta-lactamase class B